MQTNPSITEAVLTAARDSHPAALGVVLSAGYAPVYRIALALSGNDAVAHAVAELLIRRALRILPKWHDPSSAENWFYHHAVLTTRSANVPPPSDLMLDPLVAYGPAHEPAYVAFVRAIRLLPPQQREAFILHHGERLNSRILGVAMDCSMRAAETHLKAANEALGAVSDGKIGMLAAEMTRAYAALNGAMPDADTNVRVFVRRVRRRRFVQRFIRVLLVALFLGALALLGWQFRAELIQMLQ